ncbi:leucine-rich repeat domain-containing protein [Desulfosporosinus sp. FKA]|uniref:leucine-rich repeat domain-containing protein n=1 Tax=Desulfosporosinus sp. FKA TaxID=1969834 RepID=UPI000B49B6D7|nr:leucine-rich repeat domain-containing protein [Desulfosporosinus sp. FKA]
MKLFKSKKSSTLLIVVTLLAMLLSGCQVTRSSSTQVTQPTHSDQNFISTQDERYTCQVFDGMALVRARDKNIVGDLVIPGTLGGLPVAIDKEAFFDCSGLTSVVIHQGVIIIGNMAFEGCRGLTTISIPQSVKTIGSEAFLGCTGLTTIAINSATTEILTGYSGESIPYTTMIIGHDPSHAKDYATKNKMKFEDIN